MPSFAAEFRGLVRSLHEFSVQNNRGDWHARHRKLLTSDSKYKVDLDYEEGIADGTKRSSAICGSNSEAIGIKRDDHSFESDLTVGNCLKGSAPAFLQAN